ncbi:FG-GAP repeat protein [Dactylosporangium siamense]|uniref:VCBS repeat-containing protein n=1 Tax=Dactylosporangium siamense TaxID=685454 RepID=A0A919PQS1_9ACTN|nr:hypothetical protein [Dactylosporangium siamense]GIG48517.1 hypothetical protein Dsi01nite_065580 [Dactylosporangium siamense]
MRKVMPGVTALVVGAGLAVCTASPAAAYYTGRYDFGAVVDYDGDGHLDIVARTPQTGPSWSSPRALWLYPGRSVRGYSTEPRALLAEDFWMHPAAPSPDHE